MTREETKKAIRIMQAYVEGKKIEHNAGMGWHITDNPSWRFGYDIFRIAPDQEEPKDKHYRPYTMEEFVQEMHKHDGFVRMKDDTDIYGSFSQRISRNGITTYCLGFIDYKHLLDLCVWSDDGTPCGKEVEE